MPLATGTRIGPYEIVALVGAGGMGEVYRAKDLKLGRAVALKILPTQDSLDPVSRARLEREARSASSLNHPNIVTIYEVGHADGLLYVAMEYVQGRTLRDAISDGPLPLRQLLDVAAQMSDGLAKAHGAGMVHRDVKPENVMLTSDGLVKILDFGLAKAAPSTAGIDPAAHSLVTEPGTLVGTLAYMSPEQATGKSVDFRSDQFSLGAVLYEMATGRRAFKGATAAETFVAVVRDDPEDLPQLLPHAPPQLRWIIERCLAKTPEQRFGATVDLARDLAKLREHVSETWQTAPRLEARSWWRWAGLETALAAVVAIVILAAVAVRIRHNESPSSLDPTALRFKRLTFDRGTLDAARFLAGGTVIYSAAWRGNPTQVYTVRHDTLDATNLNLPAARLLAVSPRSELALSVKDEILGGWENAGTLGTVPFGSTGVRELIERVMMADWAPDGDRMAIVRDRGHRRVVEFPVGRVRFETSGWVSGLRVAPDGKHVAFYDAPYRGDVSIGRLMVFDDKSGPRSLGDYVARSLVWAPRGDEIWFASGGVISAVSLEPQRRIVYTAPGRIQLHDIDHEGRALISQYTGRREMIGHSEAGPRNLTWFDWSYPTDIASDGTRVVFEEQNLAAAGGSDFKNYAIFIRDMDGSSAVRLGGGRFPAFSPDGRSVAAAVSTGETTDVVILPVGAGETRKLRRSGILPEWLAWFPDGLKMLVVGREEGKGTRLYVQDLVNAPVPIAPEGITATYWQPISPNGRRIVAAARDRTLRLIAADGSSDVPLPGTSPGDTPIRWTPDGGSLFVLRGLSLPARIDIVEATSGVRRLWKELQPEDPAGVLTIDNVFMAADAGSYVYTYARMQHDLYIVEGLR